MPKIIYKNAAGKRLPSVTTILKNLGWSLDPLMYWAWDQGRQGLNYRDSSAATVGTIAHAAVEACIKGQEFDTTQLLGLTDEERRQVDTCVQAWHDWSDQTRLEMIASEVSLVDEKMQFGGTLDCAAIWRKRSILDLKTGNGIYPDQLCQLAAYGYLWEQNHPGEDIEEYHIIRVGKQDGSFHHHRWVDLSEAWKVFDMCLRIHGHAKKLKKMV
jgi:hypothetical protein